MAGPNLTPDTFAQGMFNFPLSGGTPGAPLVKYTREHPTAVKDFTEVWYDRNRPGKDERGSDGLGMIMKARQGRRYQLGQWPQENAYAFDPNGAVDVSDNPVGGGDPPHEQDGHNHPQDGCMSCG
jgi:hypothetical protein